MAGFSMRIGIGAAKAFGPLKAQDRKVQGASRGR
jgi:hypothetical protein